MKIVFWGTPKYAAQNLSNIYNAGHEVIAVVTQPDRKRSRGKKVSPSPVKQVALELGIPVYTTQSISKDKTTIKLLNNLNPDIYVVVAFGQLLPKEILDQPKLGCWNSHASLLPVWRGAAPIQWSIINDDSKTGICIMAMEEGLDTGPVIEQESTDINDIDNLEVLTSRLSNISSKLLVKALKNISKTKGLNEIDRLNELNAINQSEIIGNPSYARQIKKEDYLIDWSENSRTIFKKINGLYPNAYTIHHGKRVKITEAIYVDINDQYINEQMKGKSINERISGEIIMVNQKTGITVMTNDCPIQIKYGQLEGKNRTDGYTLSIQSNISVNNIIGS